MGDHRQPLWPQGIVGSITHCSALAWAAVAPADRLGEAQETVAQSEVLNTQLASDLVDTKGFKEELERMLCDSDEQSSKRIDELEKELAQMTRVANDFEQKLDALFAQTKK